MIRMIRRRSGAHFLLPRKMPDVPRHFLWREASSGAARLPKLPHARIREYGRRAHASDRSSHPADASTVAARVQGRDVGRGSPRLVPFPDSREAQHDVRDLALAWESLAESGMTMADSQAEHWLRVAAKHSPDDPALLSALGYIEQKHGATDRARELYQKALAITPSLLDACTNLGVIKAESGDLQGAVTLWRSAFERAPGRSGIGMNLARAYCRTRNYDEARRYTMRVLEFNPDLSEGKRLLRDLNASPPGCGN